MDKIIKNGKMLKMRLAKSGELIENKPVKSGKLLQSKPAKSGNKLLTIYRKYDNILSKGEVNLCKDYSKKDCLIGKNQE